MNNLGSKDSAEFQRQTLWDMLINWVAFQAWFIALITCRHVVVAWGTVTTVTLTLTLIIMPIWASLMLLQNSKIGMRVVHVSA
jgi:hypothetical protein